MTQTDREGRSAAQTGSLWVQRAWQRSTATTFLGGAVLAAGLVLIFGPSTQLPSVPTQQWWATSLRFGDALRVAATLLVVAWILGLGALLPGLSSARTRARHAALALLATGALGGAATWFAAQADLPVARVAVPAGKTVESYVAHQSRGSVRVMLPIRVKVTDVDVRSQSAVLELRNAGSEESVRNDLAVGRPLDILGFRFALVGVQYDGRVRRAVIASSAENTIPAAGSTGAKVQFAPDGPEYTVGQIVTDYLGAMGPAVELSNTDSGKFWVFGRGEDPAGSGFELERVESAPVAVLVVSKTPAQQGLGAAFALLFAAGFLLLLWSWERVPVVDEGTA